jgi:proteic killer suppression protein
MLSRFVIHGPAAVVLPKDIFPLDIRGVRRYALRVIRSFRHAGIERFFRTGSKAGIQPKHAAKLAAQLFALNRAKSAKDMNAPGWVLHALKGNIEGHWSIRVSGNWRLTFAFEEEDAVLVDYQDYH